MGTALVYHEDMTAARLLWEDPECEIECPQRLTAALEGLQQRGLEQRCLRLVAREASEAELGLVHSPEYVALLRGTQALGTQELQALSGQYDAVYFHPRTFHCARLAVGAALQLVDAVMTGAVRNGLALVRPPGHHSQRAAANGFCVFNSVAIAARHAKQKHGLHRVLIVDWDVHHGQGTQYIFEDDPSVLYFSWHRYEHRRFWPYLRESDADAVGQGQGLGFTVNLPWNQVGMGNADYMAAFLHVLLPLAFEFDPELVLVSAGFDSAIGDPEGQMQATPECFAHLTQLLQVLADGRVCAVLECPGVYPECPGSPGPLLDEPPAARPHKALAQDKALTALGKVLYLLDRLLDGQVSSGIAATPAPATAATLDVAIRCGLSHGAQRLLCVAVGQLDRPPDLTDDGRNLWLNIGGKEAAAPSTFHVCVPLPGTTGGFLNCVLALVLPLAYSFQPDLVLVALGPAHGLRDPQAALLTALLRGPAGGRVLALIDEESTPQLVGVLARVLHGEAPPSLGPFSMASPEDMQALMRLRGPLEPQWKMLQVAASP
ncbi:polyamine deacetylase HDAC10 isoform X5 [Camelus ferus]|uniref:Polyamine deacetylase HDAC10 isoform X5 n=2 Tax=Camelus TaxID=9836 RepID=A0A8B8U2V2_CAMFR|nr:polyamine deacetylase HDAC10 isoform X5 [Camelus dromedarius]XP_032348465.1 polyamine deacetylase HDAC10 isoform X5 [Camelus ferus]XP_045374280.1 polyamine deacetylase HDAC10 isoform X5 [Camelus bactrianus]